MPIQKANNNTSSINAQTPPDWKKALAEDFTDAQYPTLKLKRAALKKLLVEADQYKTVDAKDRKPWMGDGKINLAEIVSVIFRKNDIRTQLEKKESDAEAILDEKFKENQKYAKQYLSNPSEETRKKVRSTLDDFVIAKENRDEIRAEIAEFSISGFDKKNSSFDFNVEFEMIRSNAHYNNVGTIKDVVNMVFPRQGFFKQMFSKN